MRPSQSRSLCRSKLHDYSKIYLIVKTGEIPNVNEVYEAFKKLARSTEVAKAGVEVLVKDIRHFSR